MNFELKTSFGLRAQVVQIRPLWAGLAVAGLRFSNPLSHHFLTQSPPRACRLNPPSVQFVIQQTVAYPSSDRRYSPLNLQKWHRSPLLRFQSSSNFVAVSSSSFWDRCYVYSGDGKSFAVLLSLINQPNWTLLRIRACPIILPIIASRH